MLNFGPFLFVQIHGLFFSLVCASFSSYNAWKKLSGAFRGLLLNEKQKKPFVFPNNEISEASPSRLLFVPQKSAAYVFTKKRRTNQRKKYRAVIFYEIGDHMQKFSSFEPKKKKQTKIRHRMVMLQHLQLMKNKLKN